MKRIYKLLSWVIAIIIPYLLIMIAVRILISPLYIKFEYNRPNFPPDTYGFSLEDRLKWSDISIQYLLNDEGLSFLSEQYLDDGTPLYNERELSHMLDVKVLVKQTLQIFYMLVASVIMLGIWAWRKEWLKEYWNGISRGGWLTVGLLLTILIFVLVNFNQLFTLFHRIFFVGDTWLFLYSDSLIRLFPIKFWQDAFILMGVFSLGSGLILGVLGKQLSNRAK